MKKAPVTLKICNNCGKTGHKIYECTLPSISIGVILFRIKNGKREYLMICRRESFGFIDIYKKNKTFKKELMQTIINEMTIPEKNIILKKPNKNDEIIDYISSSTTSWCEPEWEFPKGRRNPGEKDIECAIREFSEETGYSEKDIHLIENVLPFEEVFIGSNQKVYKQKYYLAFNKNNLDILDKFQKSEVSKVSWLTYEECIDIIRFYNVEKKDLLTNIENTLNECNLIKM
jgi:ADP-ribose pyrophosphatase YjhB (NUDIX family)